MTRFVPPRLTRRVEYYVHDSNRAHNARCTVRMSALTDIALLV